MAYPRERRSVSPSNSRSPVRARRSRSLSRPRRSRSRSHEPEPADATNPGNNLYITGLSTRVTGTDLEKYFNKEGKVVECHLVTDPRTRESRGFAFITMETVEDADRCIKYLHRSVLEGRLITVEKAKRKRGRTPTPGKYHGLGEKRGRGGRRSRSYSPRRRPDKEPYLRDRRGRSPSPYGRRQEDYSNSYGKKNMDGLLRLPVPHLKRLNILSSDWVFCCHSEDIKTSGSLFIENEGVQESIKCFERFILHFSSLIYRYE